MQESVVTCEHFTIQIDFLDRKVEYIYNNCKHMISDTNNMCVAGPILPFNNEIGCLMRKFTSKGLCEPPLHCMNDAARASRNL